MSRAKPADRLIYLPLGGAGEIGMNAYVYGYGKPGQERLIVVDLGVTFPDMDGSPGVDLILPDLSWLFERRAQFGERIGEARRGGHNQFCRTCLAHQCGQQ